VSILGSVRWWLVVALAACRALPPPPVLSPHAPAEAEREGATTVLFVVGAAGELRLFGGGAWGVALRVERQETAHTTVGVELTGGKAGRGTYASGQTFDGRLIGGRAYGRFATRPDAGFALMYGAGLSITNTGLVTGTVHGGVAMQFGVGGAPSDHAVPIGALGVALAVPVRAGRPYGDPPARWAPMFGEAPFPQERLPPGNPEVHLPRTELYLIGDIGAIVPIGDTHNRLSADVGLAAALLHKGGLFALSLGEAQRFAGK
jgi:hypothetical protein